MSNAFAPIVRARPIPIFGRPVHQGSPPIDYSPILLLKPFGFRIAPDTLSSDENLVGQRGITPAFGYSAPHPSAGGTLTLLIHALPSAHYERVGLLPHPSRSASRYRLYARGDIRRLTFVRRARGLGFTLDEVRVLLALSADQAEDTCTEVVTLPPAILLMSAQKLPIFGRW